MKSQGFFILNILKNKIQKHAEWKIIKCYVAIEVKEIEDKSHISQISRVY